VTYILWAFIVLVTFVIQGRVSFFDVNPNLTAVLAYYAGMRKGEVKGLCIGSLIGTIEDSLSAAFLGPHLLSKGLVGYFSSFLSGSFFRWTPFLGIIGISILTIGDGVLVFLFKSFFNKMPVSFGAAFSIIAIHSLINAPIGIFVRPKGSL